MTPWQRTGKNTSRCTDDRRDLEPPPEFRSSPIKHLGNPGNLGVVQADFPASLTGGLIDVNSTEARSGAQTKLLRKAMASSDAASYPRQMRSDRPIYVQCQITHRVVQWTHKTYCYGRHGHVAVKPKSKLKGYAKRCEEPACRKTTMDPDQKPACLASLAVLGGGRILSPRDMVYTNSDATVKTLAPSKSQSPSVPASGSDGQYLRQASLVDCRSGQQNACPPSDTSPAIGQQAASLVLNRRTTGLGNLVNTCFMNSTLQCLAHTTPLRDYFLSGRFRDDLNTDNPLGTGGELTREFASLLTEMWKGDDTTIPILFKTVLGKHADQFFGHDQHDSQELAIYLLDAVHEDTNLVRDKLHYIENPELGPEVSDVVASETAWADHLKRNVSFIHNHFMGQIKSRLECPFTKNTSTTFDPTMYLSVPIPRGGNGNYPNNVTLMDCIYKYCEREQLDDSEPWYCSKCKDHVRAWKKISVYRTPPILIIHLKRFHVSSETQLRVKIDTLVNFPLVGLDLRNFVGHEEENGIEPVYDCYAVSNHFGGLGGGHCTAYCKEDDGTWSNYDDWRVTEINENEVVSPEAYVLFYIRNDVETLFASIEREEITFGSSTFGSLPTSSVDKMDVDDNVDNKMDEEEPSALAPRQQVNLLPSGPSERRSSNSAKKPVKTLKRPAADSDSDEDSQDSSEILGSDESSSQSDGDFVRSLLSPDIVNIVNQDVFSESAQEKIGREMISRQTLASQESPPEASDDDEVASPPEASDDDEFVEEMMALLISEKSIKNAVKSENVVQLDLSDKDVIVSLTSGLSQRSRHLDHEHLPPGAKSIRCESVFCQRNCIPRLKQECPKCKKAVCPTCWSDRNGMCFLCDYGDSHHFDEPTPKNASSWTLEMVEYMMKHLMGCMQKEKAAGLNSVFGTKLNRNHINNLFNRGCTDVPCLNDANGRRVPYENLIDSVNDENGNVIGVWTDEAIQHMERYRDGERVP
ncbi:hypothetical protein THAOC_36712, partial [Thalassiosira oceanica]